MKHLLNDIKRIFILTENLLYLAGKSLQRRAMRNGILISLAVSSSIIRTNYLTAQTLTPEQITTLLIGAFASYPAGTLLVRIANFMTRDNLEAAAGGHLFLTSHFKQSRLRIHLFWLWHEVFRHDPEDSPVKSRLSERNHRHSPTTAFTVDERIFEQPSEMDRVLCHALFNAGPDHTFGDDHYQAFEESGSFALRSPLPMGVQNAEVGFHLGPLEDWHEKGFFAMEDFPAKAFARDPLIKRIQKLVESPLGNSIRRMIAMETAPSFWYAFTVRKFGARLGKAINSLNREAEAQGYPDYFDAQHFIWPSVALDREVATRFPADSGIFGCLCEQRKTLLESVFSGNRRTAQRHIMRMFARDYAWIFKLRLRFDPQFAAAEGAFSPVGELQRLEQCFGLRLLKPKTVEVAAVIARTRLARLETQLQGQPPAATLHNTALEIAAYIDYKHFFRDHLERTDGRPATPIGDNLTPADTGLLLALLHRIRIYHALLKIQILDYWTIVDRIGQPE